MKYNSKLKYNKKPPDDGAIYNSGHFIIILWDNGYSVEETKNIANVDVSDHMIAKDNIRLNSNISILNKPISLQDSILIVPNINIIDCDTSNDLMFITTNINIDEDMGLNEKINLFVNIRDILDKSILLNNKISIQNNTHILDLATLKNENIRTIVNTIICEKVNSTVLTYIVKAFFVIDSNNILQPLGVLVTRDSRLELLPSTRDNIEEIPGRHGEIDFGSTLKSRLLELHVVTKDGYKPLEKSHLQRLFAKYLDPTKGYKTLIFSDDIKKTYKVKYSGKIDISNYPSWFKFVIPFKMGDPFIIGSFEKALVGSGILVNEGTHEAGLTIEIAGPTTNPSLTINEETLSYTGTIPSGKTLIIDTEKQTVKIDNSNAMANYNGTFPLLYSGKTFVTANSNVTIKWRDKWI